MACQTETTAVTQLQTYQSGNVADFMEYRKLTDDDIFVKQNKGMSDELESGRQEKSKGLTVGQSCCDDAGCLVVDSKCADTVVKTKQNDTRQTILGDFLTYKRGSLGICLATSAVIVLVAVIITKVVRGAWKGEHVTTCTKMYEMFPYILMLVFAGTVAIYSVKKLSRRRNLADQERKVCVQLAQTYRHSLTETWSSTFNISGIVFAMVIVPLFTLFSVLYTIFKFVSQIQGVVANVTPRVGSLVSLKRMSFKSTKLSAVKASIEEIIYLVFLPITIPVMIIKKLFTKQMFAAFMPFITLLTFLHRLLKLKSK